jgi:hypothetical protein
VEQKFDLANVVMVPLPYFHRLMRCYYGEGPRDGEEPAGYVQAEPESPGTHKGVALDETVLARIFQSDMKPRGAAARKRREDNGEATED